MAFGGLVLFNLAFGAAIFIGGCRGHRADDPRLLHEQLALGRLKDARHLFFTPAAHVDLAAQRPELIADADEHAYAQAAQMPPVFRSLDHQRQFDALLLAGDPTTYKPLLRHLGETKDFQLTWLDNANLIFRRKPATAWAEADLATTKQLFQGEARAIFLAGAAGKLIAIGQLPMAKRALDEAQTLGAGLPEVCTALALYDGEINHWEDALKEVNRALARDDKFTPAMTTKAQILFGAKRFSEALDISDQVVAQHPDDPSMLFLHATIAHQAHAYEREIAALKHLIELAGQQRQSPTGYRIYLGQAYASTGEAVPALTQFQEALAARDISPEQREFATDCVEKIKDRTGK